MLTRECYSENTVPFCAEYLSKDKPFNMENYHNYDRYEIIQYNKGERKFFLRDRIYHIKEGDLILIDKHELHSIGNWDEANKKGKSGTSIKFTDDFVDGIDAAGVDLLSCFNHGIVVLEASTKHKMQISYKMNEIINEYNKKADGYMICIRAKMIDLLIYLDRIMINYSDKKDISSPQYDIINDVMSYIKNNHTERLTLDDISKEAGYSKNYLCTLFKNVSGFTINQYINGVRIKEAQELLSGTSLSVTDISCQTGFDSLTHFGRVFKSTTGYTPLEYRNGQKLLAF